MFSWCVLMRVDLHILTCRDLSSFVCCFLSVHFPLALHINKASLAVLATLPKRCTDNPSRIQTFLLVEPCREAQRSQLDASNEMLKLQTDRTWQNLTELHLWGNKLVHPNSFQFIPVISSPFSSPFPPYHCRHHAIYRVHDEPNDGLNKSRKKCYETRCTSGFDGFSSLSFIILSYYISFQNKSVSISFHFVLYKMYWFFLVFCTKCVVFL